jgi:hypothetical protein
MPFDKLPDPVPKQMWYIEVELSEAAMRTKVVQRRADRGDDDASDESEDAFQELRDNKMKTRATMARLFQSAVAAPTKIAKTAKHAEDSDEASLDDEPSRKRNKVLQQLKQSRAASSAGPDSEPAGGAGEVGRRAGRRARPMNKVVSDHLHMLDTGDPLLFGDAQVRDVGLRALRRYIGIAQTAATASSGQTEAQAIHVVVGKSFLGLCVQH